MQCYLRGVLCDEGKQDLPQKLSQLHKTIKWNIVVLRKFIGVWTEICYSGGLYSDVWMFFMEMEWENRLKKTKSNWNHLKLVSDLYHRFDNTENCMILTSRKRMLFCFCFFQYMCIWWTCKQISFFVIYSVTWKCFKI